MKLRILLLFLIVCGCSQQASILTPTPQSATGTPAVPPPASDTALERKVLYYPDNEKRGDRPDQVTEVKIDTPDGLVLSAWVLPPPSSEAPLVVYFHGNGGNVSSLGGVVEDYKLAGLGVLIVDYRGFGASEGDPSEEGLYLDGLATFDFARRQYPDHPILIHGRSLGGGVASYVAAERESSGLILESTFTSAKEVARHSHGQRGAAAIDAFDTLSRLDRIKEPIFLIHGTDDETIPYFMSKELQKAAGPGIELWSIEGANHNTVRRVAGKELGERIGRFARQCVWQKDGGSPRG